MKKRESYIDVAKGLLILLLLLHHTPIQGESTVYPTMNVIKDMVLYYGPFFMAAFFIISGYCTNFSKRIVDFISGTVKGIVIPMISFTIFGAIIRYISDNDFRHLYALLTPGYYLYPSGYWFFAALIEVRLLMWIVKKYSNINKYFIGISYIVGFLGLWINKIGDAPQYSSLLSYQQAMMAFPFVMTGAYLKSCNCSPQKLLYCGLSYVFLVAILSVLHKPTPDWTYVMAMKPIHYPLFVALALTGSALIIWISSKIKQNKVLEFVGRNSLVFYGMNFVCFDLIRPKLMFLFDMSNQIHTILWAVLVYIIVFFILSLITCLLNTKYLKILIGKY